MVRMRLSFGELADCFHAVQKAVDKAHDRSGGSAIVSDAASSANVYVIWPFAFAITELFKICDSLIENLARPDGIGRAVARHTTNAIRREFRMCQPSFRDVVAVLSDKLPRPRLGTAVFGAGLLVAFAFPSHLLAHEAYPAVPLPPATIIDEAPFLKENDDAMTKMMNDMAIKPTGDVDHDFTAMMIPHHRGAIDMAQAELQYGRNQKLLRIAQEIVVEQLQEIAAMRLAVGEPASPTWVTNGAHDAPAAAPSHKTNPGGDAPFVSRSNAAMDKMMTDMAVKSTGYVDHDFVAMMVPHHQGAIDMAQAELQYGQNPQLKTIAQEIIVDQMQEIALMRLALGEPLPPSMSSPTQTSYSALQSAPPHESDANQTQMRMSAAMQMAPARTH
jgi:uncharacterized protein (DUF305 family)